MVPRFRIAFQNCTNLFPAGLVARAPATPAEVRAKVAALAAMWRFMAEPATLAQTLALGFTPDPGHFMGTHGPALNAAAGQAGWVMFDQVMASKRLLRGGTVTSEGSWSQSRFQPLLSKCCEKLKSYRRHASYRPLSSSSGCGR
jgi:hypothetical protein